MIGTSLNQYQITARVGAGGMGEVFRARDTRLNRDVAVKVLLKDFAADADRLRRFEQEAKTLAALNHPNVLTIHDAGVHEGAPYLVSELLEGKTLREEMTGGALPVRKATDYALQIAHGLAAAHGKGVIHRDLKPENIFVTKDGRVKILDFGLAKLLQREGEAPAEPKPSGAKAGQGSAVASPSRPVDADASTQVQPAADSTEPGRVMGTPNYMAPEQVRGEPTDHRADIFAFGCVLYEMLSGTRAFRRNTPVESMHAVLNDTPPELSTTNSNISPALERIVERCLEKQPDRRFQSAQDLAFAIEATRERNLPAGGTQSDTTKAWKSPPVMVGIAALLLFTIGVGWWFVHQSHKATKQVAASPAAKPSGRITSLAVKPLDDFSGDTNNAYLSDGMTEALCAALGNVSALRVPGRSSVMRFKSGQKSISEMAKELNVEAIVEGSIQRAGNRMMITVQLIEAATDRHLWATNYQRDLSDFFTVQSEVARAIANEVQARLTPEDQERLARARSANPDAVEAYLHGMNHWWQWSDEGFTNALRHFERAIEIDPSYAPAHAGVALVYQGLADQGFSPAKSAIPKAKQAAQRAIELDPLFADSYVALGNCYLDYDWDWDSSEKNLRRALQLSPNASLVLDSYAVFLMVRGRFDEAIAVMKRALEIDPLSPALQSELVWIYQAAGKFEQASKEITRLMELDRKRAHRRLAQNYRELGQTAESLTEFEAALGLDPGNVGIRSEYGYGLALAGRRAEALKVLADLDRLAQKRYVTPTAQAMVYLGLGQKGLALDWFEKAYRERDPQLVYLRVTAALRKEPHFQALLKKIEDGGREK